MKEKIILRRDLSTEDLYPYNIEYGTTSGKLQWLTKRKIRNKIQSDLNPDYYYKDINEKVNDRINEIVRLKLMNDIRTILPKEKYLGDLDAFLLSYKNDISIDLPVRNQITDLIHDYSKKEKRKSIIDKESLYEPNIIDGKLTRIEYLNDWGLNNIIRKLKIDRKKKKEIKGQVKNAQKQLLLCRQKGNRMRIGKNTYEYLDGESKRINTDLKRLEKEINKDKNIHSELIKDGQNAMDDYRKTYIDFATKCPLNMLDDSERHVLDDANKRKNELR